MATAEVFVAKFVISDGSRLLRVSRPMISCQLVQLVSEQLLQCWATAKNNTFELKMGLRQMTIRLHYRYDLRRQRYLENLKLRAKVTHSIHAFG